MTDIILTGFMGTGKSTVGRLLADRYGLHFMDTDDEIARQAGNSIPSIFESIGERGFRALETQVMQNLGPSQGRVIATGGGALLAAENRAVLREDQRVFCLTCRLDDLERRLNDPSGRPLLSGEWRELLQSREATYAQFEQIDTTDRTLADVVDEIASRTHLDRLGALQFESRPNSIVHFGRGVSHQLHTWLQTETPGGVMVVTDECVQSLGIPDRVLSGLRAAGYPGRVVTLPTGEETKSLATLDHLYARCLDAGLDRSGLVIGVGGGVIGDLAGMLAATYMRGVRLALVPTTLLAQVDAAIGGKVGVDAHCTKNLVGAFYPASHVVIDPDCLITLPEERLSEGLAEIVKIAVMRSANLLERLRKLGGPEDIVRSPDIVRRAGAEKVRVVANDPYEEGERALLNFGHTIGHGIEAASNYRLSHGHAVAVGMIAEARIGEGLGVTEPGTADLLTIFADRFRWPVKVPGIDADVAYGAMLGDKKRRGGMLHMAIPEGLGSGTVVPVPGEVARHGLTSVLAAGT